MNASWLEAVPFSGVRVAEALRPERSVTPSSPILAVSCKLVAQAPTDSASPTFSTRTTNIRFASALNYELTLRSICEVSPSDVCLETIAMREILLWDDRMLSCFIGLLTSWWMRVFDDALVQRGMSGISAVSDP